MYKFTVSARYFFVVLSASCLLSLSACGKREDVAPAQPKSVKFQKLNPNDNVTTEPTKNEVATGPVRNEVATGPVRNEVATGPVRNE
jgi:hypothetical protein